MYLQTHILRGVEIGAKSHPSILFQLQLPTEYVNSSDVFYFSVSKLNELNVSKLNELK